MARGDTRVQASMVAFGEVRELLANREELDAEGQLGQLQHHLPMKTEPRPLDHSASGAGRRSNTQPAQLSQAEAVSTKPGQLQTKD